MSVTSTGTRAPSLLRTLVLIAAMDVVARLRGFGPALSFARRLAGTDRPVAANASNEALTAATARSVIMAAAFYPRRALCLEQSLALFVLLRRRGIAAELKVGVQPLPFSAHAWVEVGGVAINEKQGHVEQLVTFQHVSV